MLETKSLIRRKGFIYNHKHTQPNTFVCYRDQSINISPENQYRTNLANIMDLSTNSQETATATTTTTTATQEQSTSSKVVGSVSTSTGLYHHSHQYHHNQSPFGHVLASPTTTTMECASPLGGTPESGFIGKLTASTSFSGSSTRSMPIHHGSKQPLQDSEDSSYDSDCEISDATTSHNDVSRTVSDTLGQEFEEYVTISARGQQTGGIVGGNSAEAFQVREIYML